MAKINYGPPLARRNVQRAATLRDSFGPGLSIGVTQRSAELATSGPQAYFRRR